MKVLLLHPVFETYFTYEAPIGIAYLKAICQMRGHTVEVLDNNVMQLSEDEIVQRLKGFDVLGISMTTPTYRAVKSLSERVRRELGIPVIIGGAHPTSDPMDTLEFADYIVLNEAEEVFPKMLELMESGKATAEELGKINGIGFHSEGKKILTEKSEQLKDLDAIPFPDWHGFPLEKYGSALRVSGRCLPIVTSRGCPYTCVYCYKGLFGWKVRTRSPKNVVDELEYLKKEFGIKEFQIADDVFNMFEEHAVGVCKEMIERKINLPWALPNGIRATQVTDNLAYWMKKAGLQYTGLGVETGSQEMMNTIGKVQTKQNVIDAVRTLKKHKIQVVGFFIFGLPGETEQTMKETIDFALSLDLDYYSISMATPYPGTKLYNMLKEGKGTMLTKNMEDLFSLGSKCKYTMPGMASPEKIEEMYRKARMKLLLRPKTILQNLTKPKRLIAGAKVAYKWMLKT
ncbi:MAG: radical SAM protein [archaeon]